MKLFEKIVPALRRSFFALMLLFGAFSASAEALRVGISPNVITENRPANFIIYCDGDEKIRGVPAFPEIDGLVWLTNRRGSQTSWVNGKTTRAETFGFTVSRTGEIEIPAFRVETSDGEKMTRPFKFTVGKLSTGLTRDDGSEMPLSEAVFLRVQFPTNARETYFVGEEIPVWVCALSRPGLEVRYSAQPTLAAGTDAFVAAFQGAQESSATFQNERYNAAIFTFRLRAMKAGTFDAAFESVAECLFADNARDAFNDPFAGTFSRHFSLLGNTKSAVPVKLSGKLEKIDVRARPLVPAGTIDLGIVSEAAPSWEFSAENAKCGEPLYLDLKIRGNAAGLIAPEPKINGFRTYPSEILAPEKNKSGDETRVRMMLIPLEPGEKNIELNFAALNPETGNYSVCEIRKTISVEENQTLPPNASGNVADARQNAIPRTETNAAKREAAYIRPLTPETLERGKTPPARFGLALCLAPLGILALAAAFTKWRSRAETADSAARERRRRARSRKNALLKKLAEASPENFDALVREDVADWLADAKGAASAETIRDEIRRKNPELAEVLDAAEKAGYRPNAHCAHFEKFREIVVRAVKSGAFLLAFAWIANAGTPEAAAEISASESTLRERIFAAEDAYARGDFAAAEKSFAALAEQSPFAADVWFNLGNALFQQNKNAVALVCFERAARLEAAHADCLANLNAVRERLGLPPRGEVKTPGDALAALRDAFSPGTWALFALAGFAAGTLAGTFMRRHRLAAFALGCAIFAFGVCNFVSRQNFAEDAAAAIALRELSVKNLPIRGGDSLRVVATLPAGTFVKIADSRGDCRLIRAGGNVEGWVEASAIARLWGERSVPAAE